MNCKKIEELILTDYIDGNLKAEALREVGAHLASCPNCRKLAAEAVSAGKLFTGLKKEEPPADLWYKVRAEIAAERGQPVVARALDSVRYFFKQIRPAVAIAAAVVLIFFILTVTQLMPGKSMIPGAVYQDDILVTASLNNGWDEPEQDFGTSAEQYFL